MDSQVLCVSEQAIVESETILYHLQVCRWPWRPGPPLTCCSALNRLHTSSSCSCYGCCCSHRHSHGHGHCGCPAGEAEPGAKPIWSGEAPSSSFYAIASMGGLAGLATVGCGDKCRLFWDLMKPVEEARKRREGWEQLRAGPNHPSSFSSQMGTGQSFNSQFLQHGGPRGPSVPPGMSPSGMGGMMGPSGLSSMAMNPTRAAGMTPLYAGQRLPQHGYPGPPQAQPLPRQGVKRAYSEVSVLLAQSGVLDDESLPSRPRVRIRVASAVRENYCARQDRKEKRPLPPNATNTHTHNKQLRLVTLSFLGHCFFSGVPWAAVSARRPVCSQHCPICSWSWATPWPCLLLPWTQATPAAGHGPFSVCTWLHRTALQGRTGSQGPVLA